ncbi:hypothetical protein MPER_11747 [Moniliophthora perniciosa FA553]|nr:hypothetical protein MPER_11747 [Moniliophthora perniciosa FA553]
MRTYYCKAGSDMEASTTREVPPRALAALGVKIWSCDVANYQSELGRAAKEYGYPADAVLETFDSTLAGGCHGSQDVSSSGSKFGVPQPAYMNQKYEKMRDQYQERYTFPEDCVACVLSGQTMFDVDGE